MGILATPASFAAGWPWVLPPTGPSQQLCVRTKQRRRVKLPVHSKVAPRLPCASGRWPGACCPREGRLRSCLLRSLARRVRHGVQGGRPAGRRRLPGFFLSPWGCGGTPPPPPRGAPLPCARESPPGTRGLSAGRPGAGSRGLPSPSRVGREEWVTGGCFNSVPEIRGDFGDRSLLRRGR